MRRFRLNIPPRTIFTSFFFAFRGLWYAVVSQRNMKIHLGVACFALALAIRLHISSVEWALLLLSIMAVVVTEMINTAIEVAVDLTTRKRRLRAMLSKDMAAGAVFLAALNSIVIGLIVFLPHLIPLITKGL